MASDAIEAAVRRGRELAAADIEAEAQAYESQYKGAGLGGHAAAVLTLAARIARDGHT